MYCLQPVCKVGIPSEEKLDIGADYIATGHYAQIAQAEERKIYPEDFSDSCKGPDVRLYNLTQEQLSRTLMPIGAYTKEEIREMAKQLALPVANKPDSQEICFVPDNDYAKFIEDNTEKKIEEGNFVTTSGEVVGRHRGITTIPSGREKV